MRAIRGLRFGCGAFQHHGRGSCEQRLHRHDDNAADFTAATPAPRNSASPAHVVWRHAFLRAERLRERRSKRGFRPHRVTRPSLAQLRNVHVRRSAGAASRAGHRVEQQRRRLLARGRSDGLRPDRPSARAVGDRTGRRNARRRPQRWRTRSDPGRAGDGVDRGHEVHSECSGRRVWATNIGFSAPLPLVATGHYSATVTFTALAR